jgi:hypothetical protein
MRVFLMVSAFLGATGCATSVSTSAFCAATYSGAVERLASEALAASDVPEPLGNAVADVVTGHRAGCAK